MKVYNIIIKEAYTAYGLTPDAIAKLKDKFPPKYKDFIGHHITDEFGVPYDTALIPEKPESVEVVGYKNDPEGLEALVVSINGSTKRKDGKIYHITWSLDRSKGFKPVDSNTLLSDGKYSKVSPSIEIMTTPGIFK